MKIFYRCAIVLAAIVCLLRRKSRLLFIKKWGRELLQIKRPNGPLIWVHAVSFGETRAIAPLVKQLKRENPEISILITNGTATGHEEAKKVINDANWHCYLPFDFPFLIKQIINKLKPTLLILSETDFWHYLQTNVKKNGGRIVVVNGKISENSFKRLSHLKSLSYMLFNSIDLFCAQGVTYEERFKQLGVPSSKIIVTGNLKIDGMKVADESEKWKKTLCIKEQDIVITCGSTHDPEEKLFIKTFKQLHLPHLKLLIVPRHPQRFRSVTNLLKEENLSFSCFSKGETFETAPIVLVDKMGILRQCYQVSNIAFVGGTLTSRIGGHNLLEPSCYGVPVVYGPYLFSQPDLASLLQSYNAGIKVTDHTLKAVLTELIESPQLRSELGKNGLKLVQESAGSLERTLKILKDFLSIEVNSSNRIR